MSMETSAYGTALNIFGISINVYGAFILLLFFLFFYLLYKAQKNNKLDWVDLITKDGKKVSLTKILQLIGGTVGTWIAVQVTLDGNLTWDIFAIYLAYVASIDGFSKFLAAKYRIGNSDRAAVPELTRQKKHDSVETEQEEDNFSEEQEYNEKLKYGAARTHE